MSEEHFRRRRALERYVLGFIAMIVAGVLLFLLTLIVGEPVRRILGLAGLGCAMTAMVCFLAGLDTVRALERENLDEIQRPPPDWDQTKRELAELQKREGRL